MDSGTRLFNIKFIIQETDLVVGWYPMPNPDQDGDLDLILGSYILGPIPDGSPLKEEWQNPGKPFLILQNQLFNKLQ